jgi:hypothetical protein
MKGYDRVLFVVLLSFGFIAGCGSSKKMAAETVISTAETAYTPIANEAQKYVPDEAKNIQDSLQQAKASVANGDYSAALDSAKDLPSKIKDLTDAIKAKKDELKAKWNGLSNSMPGLVSAAQNRIGALQKANKLPAGANDAFASVKQMWSDASASFQAGDLASAMEKATAAKEKLAEVQKMLGMKAPF